MEVDKFEIGSKIINGIVFAKVYVERSRKILENDEYKGFYNFRIKIRYTENLDYIVLDSVYNIDMKKYIKSGKIWERQLKESESLIECLNELKDNDFDIYDQGSNTEYKRLVMSVI